MTQPRDSHFAEALRILANNPNDRAVRISRATIEGMVKEMADVAHALKAAHAKPVNNSEWLEPPKGASER